jgi:hypothetical protein
METLPVDGWVVNAIGHFLARPLVAQRGSPTMSASRSLRGKADVTPTGISSCDDRRCNAEVFFRSLAEPIAKLAGIRFMAKDQEEQSCVLLIMSVNHVKSGVPA